MGGSDALFLKPNPSQPARGAASAGPGGPWQRSAEPPARRPGQPHGAAAPPLPGRAPAALPRSQGLPPPGLHRGPPRPAAPREEGEGGSTCRPAPLRASGPVAERCYGECPSPAIPRPSPTAEPLGAGPGRASRAITYLPWAGPRIPPAANAAAGGARRPGAVPTRPRAGAAANQRLAAAGRAGAGRGRPALLCGRVAAAAGRGECSERSVPICTGPDPAGPLRIGPDLAVTCRDMPCAAPAAPRGPTRAMSQAALPSQIEARRMSEGALRQRGRGRQARIPAALADPC